MAQTSGNHFERKKIDGEEYWFWEDKVGSQCGRERKWKYKVQVGDSYVQQETCPQGYVWYEINYYGTPEKI
ncbi:hypothetical protein PZB74_10645 [Porifericola rhodea]|uniref:hypothetical protein n=1 Tax=Porifericola rhodea TaxID=930972 RepID=UPI0026668B7F|nr:hypothetical protein [Porifericola rhodea]WKN33782.1 hypothetical protein PZB74_10645 [Porifericola rhodea]